MKTRTRKVLETGLCILAMCAFYAMPFMLLCALTGCLSTMFRDKVEIKRVDVERYDPKTGRPRKTCRVVDKREIEVEYTASDGTTWTEKHSLEGGNWSPKALPEPKAEIVPQ